MDIIELNSKKVPELKAIAKTLNIKVSNKRKQELYDEIVAALNLKPKEDDLCAEWSKQRLSTSPINPLTNRVIKKDGPKYKELEKKCGMVKQEKEQVKIIKQKLQTKFEDLLDLPEKEQYDILDSMPVKQLRDVAQKLKISHTGLSKHELQEKILPLISKYYVTYDEIKELVENLNLNPDKSIYQYKYELLDYLNETMDDETIHKNILKMRSKNNKVHYDRIIIYKQAEFYRVERVRPNTLFGKNDMVKILYSSPERVSHFEKKYNLMIQATEMMSGNLEHTVKSIIDLFDNDNYSGYIRVYQKGGNKGDFKKYVEEHERWVLPNQQLYNIGFCFKPARKNKFYKEILINKVESDPTELLRLLHVTYPEVDIRDSHSRRIYSILTPSDLEEIDNICHDFTINGYLPKTPNTHKYLFIPKLE